MLCVICTLAIRGIQTVFGNEASVNLQVFSVIADSVLPLPTPTTVRNIMISVTAAVMDAVEAGAGAGVRTTVGVTAAVMDAAEAGAGVVHTVLIDMIDMIDKEKSIERTQGV